MSFRFEELCSRLILEYFGPVAEKIQKELQWGPKNLQILLTSSGYPAPLVKRVLCILIQYGFVIFEPGKNPNIAEYKLLPDKILLLLRYPRYLSLINSKYGEAARLIIEEVLRRGSITATKVILIVWTRIKDGAIQYKDGIPGLRDTLFSLIKNQYLMCCKSPDPESLTDRVPKMTVIESDLFKLPDVDVAGMSRLDSNKGTLTEIKDAHIFWKCNFERFHQDLRDQVMLEAIKRRFDGGFLTIFEVALKKMYLRTDPWATQSNPVPIIEIKEELDKRSYNNDTSQYLDQYFKIMEEDSCSFIYRVMEGSMGSICINLVSAFKSLATATIEDIVEKRYGNKAARIFRLVRSKRYIDQEKLQKQAMIPDKEAKQITYKLLQANFLHMQELRKSVSAGPVKNFYLFHVDFNQVVQVVLDMCYKASYNTLKRTDYEKSKNMRLIEKFEKLNSIAKTMNDQGEDERHIKTLMDEWVSPPEREIIESVEAVIKKLRLAELNLDDTIFILQLYVHYDIASLKEKS